MMISRRRMMRAATRKRRINIVVGDRTTMRRMIEEILAVVMEVPMRIVEETTSLSNRNQLAVIMKSVAIEESEPTEAASIDHVTIAHQTTMK